jgi:hypothetical protein
MADKKTKPRFGPQMGWRYVLWIAALVLGIALVKYLTWLTMH